MDTYGLSTIIIIIIIIIKNRDPELCSNEYLRMRWMKINAIQYGQYGTELQKHVEVLKRFFTFPYNLQYGILPKPFGTLTYY